MNTAVCCMYDDLEALNVDVVDVKLKNNFAIAFFDNFLVIDRSKCKTAVALLAEGVDRNMSPRSELSAGSGRPPHGGRR